MLTQLTLQAREDSELVTVPEEMEMFLRLNRLCIDEGCGVAMKYDELTWREAMTDLSSGKSLDKKFFCEENSTVLITARLECGRSELAPLLQKKERPDTRKDNKGKRKKGEGAKGSGKGKNERTCFKCGKTGQIAPTCPRGDGGQRSTATNGTKTENP